MLSKNRFQRIVAPSSLITRKRNNVILQEAKSKWRSPDSPKLRICSEI